MLDVHPPHSKIHGISDFLLHLFTITVGLLIALGLEGCVEWQHHRHLVHESETEIRREIEENAKGIGPLRQQVIDQQKQLDQDLSVLAELKMNPKAKHQNLSFSFRMLTFDDVTWKTAQTTGVLALMPYDDAALYSNIYNTQSGLDDEQKQIMDDVMRAASLMDTKQKDEEPTPAEIDLIAERIGMVQLRLSLLNSYIDGLDKAYKKFGTEHAGG